MMKRFSSIFLFILFVITVTSHRLAGQSGDYLKAPVIAPGDSLLLAVGQDKDGKTFFTWFKDGLKPSHIKLDDEWTALNQSDVSIAVWHYNPLSWKFDRADKEVDSSAWTNLQTIFSAAADFGKGFKPQAELLNPPPPPHHALRSPAPSPTPKTGLRICATSLNNGEKPSIRPMTIGMSTGRKLWPPPEGR
jgi:hypothetical protein